MSSKVFCNRCFQPPQSTSLFSLTNCGHLFCDICLKKGKKDECMICKTPCRTILLSKHTDTSIQAFFMGIDGLCTKYSKETSQISEFQEKHRKRLLAFYRGKISKLEESLRKAALQIEQLQSMRPSQQTASSIIKSSISTPLAKPHGHLFFPLASSASERVESMQVDVTPSPARRPEVALGPARMSLISPPQDGRMGNVCHRGPQHLGLTPSQADVPRNLRIPLLQIPYKGLLQTPPSQLEGRAVRRDTPSLMDSQVPARRSPISIAGLLQRQHTGKFLK
ncbi:putative E3 SUMO-protein ligase RNF212 [Rhynchocyon petersi]